MLTSTEIVTIIIKKFRRGQGAPVFFEGGACAMAQWHNGQSKPDTITPITIICKREALP